MRTISLIAAIFCLTACANAAPEPTRQPSSPSPASDAIEINVDVDGTQRSLILLPPKPTRALHEPLVMIFHGGGGSAKHMQGRSADLANDLVQRGYAVAFMNGSTRLNRDKLRTWNADYCCAYALKQDIDEPAYVNAALDAIAGHIRLDVDRVFLMGHSNGAMLSYRIADELAIRPRGLIIISGGMFDDQPDIPSGTSVLAFHAVDDETLSFAGSSDDKSDRFRTAPHKPFDAVETFLANDLSCDPARITRPANGTTIRNRACAAGAHLEIIRSDTGGHRWPQEITGFDLQSEIVDFVERQK